MKMTFYALFNIVGLLYYCKNIDRFYSFPTCLWFRICITPIECEIQSLKLAIELLLSTSANKEHFVNLAHLDENRHNAILASEAH